MLIQGFHIGVIDVAFFVIALLFAIAGFKKGFIKELFGISAFAGAVAISYFFATYAKEMILNQTPLYTLINDTLKSNVFTGNALFDTVIDGSQPGALQALTDGLTQIGLPAFLASPLAGILVNFNGPLGEALAGASADLSVTIISYLAVFLIAWLVLWIVFKQLGKLTLSTGLLKLLDSSLGLVFGLGRAAVLIAIVVLIAVPVSLFVPQVQYFLNSDLDLLNPNSFSITKFIYQFILNYISAFL